MIIESNELLKSYRGRRFRNEFIDGYKQYKKTNNVNKDNVYLQILRHKVDDCCYAEVELSTKSLPEVCRGRFEIIDSMSQIGYDSHYPIGLYKGNTIYNDGPYVIEDMVFHRIDGHHRLYAACYLEIPVHVSYYDLNFKRGKVNITEALRQNSQVIMEYKHIVAPLILQFFDRGRILFDVMSVIGPILIAEMYPNLKCIMECNCEKQFPLCESYRSAQALGSFIDNIEFPSRIEKDGRNFDLLVTEGKQHLAYPHCIQKQDDEWSIVY